MDSVETQWFYLYEGASRIGPVVFSTLQERAKRGLLHPTDYVWREGLRDWTQACKATDLFPDYSSSPVIVESSAPQSLPPVPSERGASAEMYAGFLRRAVAYAVDWCLLGPLVAANRAVFRSLESANTEEALGSLLFLWLAPWLYYSLMECSSLQGTVGKLLLGIMVVDENECRIGFWRATLRYYGKVLSSICLGIGYLMVLFTSRKQALHDMIAGCLVIKKSAAQWQRASRG